MTVTNRNCAFVSSGGSSPLTSFCSPSLASSAMTSRDLRPWEPDSQHCQTTGLLCHSCSFNTETNQRNTSTLCKGPIYMCMSVSFSSIGTLKFEGKCFGSGAGRVHLCSALMWLLHLNLYPSGVSFTRPIWTLETTDGSINLLVCQKIYWSCLRPDLSHNHSGKFKLTCGDHLPNS